METFLIVTGLLIVIYIVCKKGLRGNNSSSGSDFPMDHGSMNMNMPSPDAPSGFDGFGGGSGGGGGADGGWGDSGGDSGGDGGGGGD